jgi:hypothetical protein
MGAQNRLRQMKTLYQAGVTIIRYNVCRTAFPDELEKFHLIEQAGAQNCF